MLKVCVNELRRALDDTVAGAESIAAYRALGGVAAAPLPEAWLGERRARAGSAAAGLALVDEALARVGTHGESLYRAELHRLRGECLVRVQRGTDRAEAAFQRALAIARSQGARWWELRAAISLARLRIEQRRHADARRLLAPLCAAFDEGADTADLRAARALLGDPV